MKFITRELYDGMQGGPATWRLAERRWQVADGAREKHFRTIKNRLPQRMREFAAISLHDGVIESVGQGTPDEVRLLVDCSGCRQGPAKRFEMTFLGVRKSEGLHELAGDIWLYEEVDLHPDAGFEFSALLHRGEFLIVADDVAFRHLSDGSGKT